LAEEELDATCLGVFVEAITAPANKTSAKTNTPEEVLI
jgi:hypothetical protein